MKNMKKLLSVMMAFMMVLGFTMFTTKAITAETATITISNPEAGKEYTAYQLLSLNDNSGKVYQATKAQKDFFDNFTHKVDDGSGNQVDENWFTFTLVEGTEPQIWNVTFDAEPSATDIVTYIKSKPEAELNTLFKKSVTATATPTTQITGLTLGYYFINSNTGSVIELDTINKDMPIRDKNKTNFDKKVDGSTEDEYKVINDKNVGESVPFIINFTAGKNWTDVKVTDILDAGLDFNTADLTDSNKFSVKVGEKDLTFNSDYFVDYQSQKVKVEEGSDAEEETGKHILTIRFANSLFTATDNVGIEIKYSATVNEKATYTPITSNNAQLSDANDPNIGNDNVGISFYQFGIHKYEGNDTTKHLADVEFELYKSNDLETKLVVIPVKDSDDNIIYYRPAGSTEYSKDKDGNVVPNNDNEATVTLKTNSSGQIIVKGLELDTYKLKETKPLSGYNPLTYLPAVKVEPNSDNKEILLEQQTNITTESPIGTFGGIGGISNTKGQTLPETGGMGTTLFYVVGGALLVGAVVFMITNKRMQKN